MNIKIKIWPWLFKIPPFRGMAGTAIFAPYLIFKDRASATKYLDHEMVHVRQMQDLGRWRFYFSYLNESRKHGYRQNKYEREAYDETSDHRNT